MRPHAGLLLPIVLLCLSAASRPAVSATTWSTTPQSSESDDEGLTKTLPSSTTSPPEASSAAPTATTDAPSTTTTTITATTTTTAEPTVRANNNAKVNDSEGHEEFRPPCGDFQPARCPAGVAAFHRIEWTAGCPVDICVPCPDGGGGGATDGRRLPPECRGVECPALASPPCLPSSGFLNVTVDAAGCPALSCTPCPAHRQRPPTACPPGQFMRHHPAGHCQPWTCQDCDFQHRDLPACRRTPDADRCPRTADWGLDCGPGRYRRARTVPTTLNDDEATVVSCPEVECASCADAANNNATADTADEQLPAECRRRPCPQQPPVAAAPCEPGAAPEVGVDAAGCSTVACRPLARDECAAGRLDYAESDCLAGFHLADALIDGCAARVCLPCPPPGAADDSSLPPPTGCRRLPAACDAAAAAAADAAAAGLPNCTAGAQRLEQVIDPAGCPSLVCADCPSSRPACPAGHREAPRPTKWLQCQLFDCRGPAVANPAPADAAATVAAFGDSAMSPLACPAQQQQQQWHDAPTDFGTEWLQLDDGCRLRRYHNCPEPAITCRNGQLPLLLTGNADASVHASSSVSSSTSSSASSPCQYVCTAVGHHGNNSTGSGPGAAGAASPACFPGQHYIIFLIDVNRAKSPFQIRFQVASFIARLSTELRYGPDGVQFGAICYAGRVLDVISPDEFGAAAAASPDGFLRRLLLLRHRGDDSSAAAATATGEAVAAAAELLRELRRPSARRSLVALTDTATNAGRSLREAAAELPAGTDAYFVSLSGVWNPRLRAEAQAFVSEPGRLVELTSYRALASTGVQLLFPGCYRACDPARHELDLRRQFVRRLRDSVHSYEDWLVGIYAAVGQQQEALEAVQYLYESKQIRLELCSRMLSHYKSTAQRLQQQLDSLQVMRAQAGSEADYERSLGQVRQLEQRLEALAARKAQLAAQLQDALARIGAAEDRVAQLRAHQAAQVAAEDARIAALEARSAAAWKSLQTLTQELLLRRMAASNAEATVREQEARIRDVLLLNSDLATRLGATRARVGELKVATNSSHVVSYVQTQELLTACESRAALDGFSPLALIRASSGVRVEQVLDALLLLPAENRHADWMESPSSPEMQLYSQLLNFTVGTYAEVKLVLRSATGQARGHFTFRSAATSLGDFFGPANLVSCAPWRLETVKESLGLAWSLHGGRFPSLLFAIMSGKGESGCSNRRGLLAVVTRADRCEDLAGPFPRLRFSPSAQPVALSEMEDLAALELLAKPLPSSPTSDFNWLPGLIASADMPVTLSELLSNGMLSYPAELAPSSLRPGLFFKSRLLRHRRDVDFPLTRLRLTDSAGRVRQLSFNGSFDSRQVLDSTWSPRLLAAARLFATQDASPYGYAIGDASPCRDNATGVLFFNLDNRCPDAADARRGWSVLMSPEADAQVAWASAERAAYVEILLGRRATLVA